MNWIHVVWDMDQLQVLVNTVMTLQIPLRAGNFLTS